MIPGFSSFGLMPFSGYGQYDASVSSPLSALLAGPTDRTWLLTAWPGDGAGGTVEVRIGSKGFWSQSSDDPPSTLWEAGLEDPYSFKLDVMPGGRIKAGAVPFVGDVTISNPNGEFDHLLGLVWAGATIQIRLGNGSWEGLWPYSDFGPVFYGTADGITGDQVTISLQLRNLRHLLEQPHQAVLYAGRGEALLFDGADAEATLANAAPALGDLTVQAWIEPWAIADDLVRILSSFALPREDGMWRWLQRSDVAGSLTVQFRNGGAYTSIKTQGLLQNRTWVHVSMVVDFGALAMRIYVNGALREEDALLQSSTLHPAQDLEMGHSGSSDHWQGTLDEVRIWRYARTAAEILDDYQRTLSGHESGLMYYYPYEEAAGSESENRALRPWRVSVDCSAAASDRIQVPDAVELQLPSAPHSIGGWVRLHSAVGSGSLATLWRKAGNYELLFVGSTGTLRLLYRDGSGLERQWDTGAGSLLKTNVWHHILIAISADSSLGCTIYVDTVKHSVFYSQASATQSLGAVLEIGGRADGANPWPGEIGAFEIWSSALSKGEIVDQWERIHTGGEAGLEAYLPLDERTGATAGDLVAGNDGALQGTAAWADTHLTLTGGYTWSTSGEGGPELTGKPKPRALGGPVRQFELVAISPRLGIWQFHDGPAEGSSSLFALELLDRGVPWQYLGDTTELPTKEPSGPEFWTDLSRGLIKAGQDPAGKLLLSFLGDNAGGYTASRFELIRRLALRSGLPEVAINAGSFAAAEAGDVAGDVQIATRLEPVETIRLMERLAAPDGYVTFDRLGLLTVGLLPIPGSAPAVQTLGADDIEESGIRLQTTAEPTWRHRVGYWQLYTVQSLDDLAGVAIELESKRRLGEEYRFVCADDLALLQEHPGANDEEILTQIATLDGALRMGQRLKALFGPARRIIRLPVPESLFQYFVGTHVETNYERYGLAGAGGSAKPHVVVGFEEDASGQIAVLIWGSQ